MVGLSAGQSEDSEVVVAPEFCQKRGKLTRVLVSSITVISMAILDPSTSRSAQSTAIPQRAASEFDGNHGCHQRITYPSSSKCEGFIRISWKRRSLASKTYGKINLSGWRHLPKHSRCILALKIRIVFVGVQEDICLFKCFATRLVGLHCNASPRQCPLSAANNEHSALKSNVSVCPPKVS